MAETSIQDIKDFHDVIRLLEEHPEWRTDLRRVLLTDDLLVLPEQMARLTEQVAALATAQARTAARLADLVEAQGRINAQLSLLTERVAVLADGQQRLIDDIGTLKERDLERTYREKVAVFFDTLVQDPHAVAFAEIRPLLDDATQRGVLSPGERRELSRTDLFVHGKHPQTGEDVYLVVEVSWSVHGTDVERAAKRAALLHKLGLQVLAVVAGEGITPEAHQAAGDSGVWQVMDGTVLPPSGTNENT